MSNVNIRSRIQALEKLAFNLAPPNNCPKCGGPSPGINRVVLCDAEGTPRDPQCPECGLLVDGERRALPSSLALARGERPRQKRILIVS